MFLVFLDQVQFDDPPPSSSPMQDTLQHDHFYGDQVASDNLQEDPPGEASEERPEQQASELGNLDEQIKQTFEEAREQLGQLLDQISDHLTSQISRNNSNRRTAPNRYSGVISTFENMIEIFKPIEERINRTTQQKEIECITLETIKQLNT
ncbi:hypothetical protein M3Y97_01086300 [Aphelenchoides bicaudatus]|nr:hypothetical protein M3Y97_01086300 [Aphelenchoides bicaudatus]